MNNDTKKPDTGVPLKRMVLRIVCRIFGHKLVRVERIGSMRVESQQFREATPLCYRCHPSKTLAQQIKEAEESENDQPSGRSETH